MTRPHRRRPYTPSRGRLAGQRFATEYAYRKALAATRGLRSLREARDEPIPVFTPQDFERLTEEQRESRRRILNTLADMRSHGWSLTRAARENHTEMATVRRYVGTALRRDRSRRRVPKSVDRLVRRLLVHTEQGDKVLDLTDSRQATLVADHANALRQFSRTGDPRVLAPFRRRVLQIGKVKYRLVTAPAEAERVVLADRGESEIYQPYR